MDGTSTCAWLPREEMRGGMGGRREKLSGRDALTLFTLTASAPALVEESGAARDARDAGLGWEAARNWRASRGDDLPATGAGRDVEEAGRLRARIGSATRAAKSAEASSTKEARLAVEEAASRTRGEAPAEVSRLLATRGSGLTSSGSHKAAAWYRYGTEVSRETWVGWSRAECELTQGVSVLGAEALTRACWLQRGRCMWPSRSKSNGKCGGGMHHLCRLPLLRVVQPATLALLTRFGALGRHFSAMTTVSQRIE